MYNSLHTLKNGFWSQNSVHPFFFYCFRTDDPPAAKELLSALDIDEYFTYKEIYPGSKVSHFKR